MNIGVGSLCFLFAFIATGAGGFSAGDIVVSGQDLGLDPLDIGRNKVILRWFNSSGSVQGDIVTVPQSSSGQATFAPDGTVAAVIEREIRFVRSDGTTARVLGPLPNFMSPYSLAFSRSGTLFVATISPGMIFEFASDGSLVRTFTLPDSHITGIDLAADQCRLYYAAGVRLGAFDVCTGSSLPPVVTTLPSNGSGGLRILPDGTLLISNQTTLLRFTSGGTLLRTYSTSGALAALDVDPRFAWIATGAGIQRVDLTSDVLVGSPIVPGFTVGIAGVAVAGEPRAALAASIPSLSPLTLALISMVLLGIGLLMVRRM